MEYVNSVDIISKKVLNETTGEIEPMDFKQIKQTKRVKGGFGMFYKSYEEAVENTINSKLDYTILLEVKNQFTYARIECVISPTDIAKKVGCTKSKVDKVINSMAKEQLILKVARGVYRLNPFMVLPFRSDAEVLQSEWKDLIKRISRQTS